MVNSIVYNKSCGNKVYDGRNKIMCSEIYAQAQKVNSLGGL